MSRRRSLGDREGVSPVIATLLMIAIAVAAAIITYVWAVGLIGGLQGGGGEQTAEQLEILAYDWTVDHSANATAQPGGKVFIKNTGSKALNITELFIGGKMYTKLGTGTTLGTAGMFIVTDAAGASNTIGVIAVGETCIVLFSDDMSGLPLASIYTTGTSYTIKLVTRSGGGFSGQLVKGQSR